LGSFLQGNNSTSSPASQFSITNPIPAFQNGPVVDVAQVEAQTEFISESLGAVPVDYIPEWMAGDANNNGYATNGHIDPSMTMNNNVSPNYNFNVPAGQNFDFNPPINGDSDPDTSAHSLNFDPNMSPDNIYDTRQPVNGLHNYNGPVDSNTQDSELPADNGYMNHANVNAGDNFNNDVNGTVGPGSEINLAMQDQFGGEYDWSELDNLNASLDSAE
jgi:hypothetical protein